MWRCIVRADYVLYKTKYLGRLSWSARFFWDKESCKYLKSRNLGIPVEGKKERSREAEQAAENVIAELQKDLSPKIKTLSGPAPSVANTPLLSYLTSFWEPGSDYIEEQGRVNKTPLSSMYIESNRRQIRLHLSPCPMFEGVLLSGITRKIIRDYKLWGAKRGMSGRLINQCLQTMRIAVRYAVANGDIPSDPFYGAGKAYHKEKEKGILTFSEMEELKTSPVKDYYSRLAVLLGLLCGMRRGEIRGLLWGDIGDGVITIRHNYVEGDGLKNPKRKGGLIQENTRTVPMPKKIANLLNVVVKISNRKGPDDFVIQSAKQKENSPVSAKYFDHALNRELSAIGIPGRWPHHKKQPDNYVNMQKERNITFHSLRHCFVTFGRLSGLNDLEIQSLAGHGPRMMERYTHGGQVIDVRQCGEKLEGSLPQLPAIKGGAKDKNDKRLRSREFYPC